MKRVVKMALVEKIYPIPAYIQYLAHRLAANTRRHKINIEVLMKNIATV